MRSKKQLVKLAIILSSILLSISSLNNIIISEDSETDQNDVLDKNNENNNLIPPKSSGAWTLDYIDIDDSGGATHGTWAQCEANYDWCSFDGIYYVLEEITIIGGSGTGISIANSNVPFRIENCTILQKYTGIKFESVSNGEIRNCYIEGVVGWWWWGSEGISLSDCDYIDIDGNLIKGSGMGIEIYSSNNSYLTHNHIFDIDFGIVFKSNYKWIIEENLISNGEIGIGLSDTHNCLFNKNFLIDNIDGFGYPPWWYMPFLPCENNTYINNVIINIVENEEFKEKKKNKINKMTTDQGSSLFIFGALIIGFVLTLIFVIRKTKVEEKKKK